MKIVREIQIDYGHCLPRHYGFCNQIHGHRGKIECFFEGDIIKDDESSSNGMVMDFSICKKIMMQEIHDVLDHGFAIWADASKDFIFTKCDDGSILKLSTLEFIKARNKKVLVLNNPPTAEIIGRYFFEKIQKALIEMKSDVKLVELHWWETPNNRAIIK